MVQDNVAPEWVTLLEKSSEVYAFSEDPAQTIGDLMFKSTLRTEDGVSVFRAFIQKTEEGKEKGNSNLPNVGKWEPESLPFGCIHYIIKVGASLEGHRGFLHGGLIAALMDEITGFASVFLDPQKDTFTGQLNIRFINPVKIPAWIYGKSWIEKREGRKRFVIGILGDGNGKVYATTSTIFVEKDRSKL